MRYTVKKVRRQRNDILKRLVELPEKRHLYVSEKEYVQDVRRLVKLDKIWSAKLYELQRIENNQ